PAQMSKSICASRWTSPRLTRQLASPVQTTQTVLAQCLINGVCVHLVEIYFSVIQRKVLTPNDFTSLAEVEERLLAFERRYERTALPFERKFTRHDLAKLMERLADKPDYPIAA
ncbi:MAG TPA: hypothetical protein VIR57_12840, partial [Chloroflexota bacterium]